MEYSKLADEHFTERGDERFTGAFVGICCQTFTDKNIHTDFDDFTHSTLSPASPPTQPPPFVVLTAPNGGMAGTRRLAAPRSFLPGSGAIL